MFAEFDGRIHICIAVLLFAGTIYFNKILKILKYLYKRERITLHVAIERKKASKKKKQTSINSIIKII